MTGLSAGTSVWSIHWLSGGFRALPARWGHSGAGRRIIKALSTQRRHVSPSAVDGVGRRFLGRHEGCHGVCARGEEKGRDSTTSAGSLLLFLTSSEYRDAADRRYD